MCVLGPHPAHTIRAWQSATIYPWWALALALGSLGIAMASAVARPSRAVVTVAAGAALALAGPQMVDLVYPQPYRAFAAALVLTLAVLWLRTRGDASDARAVAGRRHG